MGLNFAPKILQSPKLTVPCFFLSNKQSYRNSSLLTGDSIRRNQALAYRLFCDSSLFASCKSGGHNLKAFCSASFNEFSNDELLKQIEELRQTFDIVDDDDDLDKGTKETPCSVSEVSVTSFRNKGESDIEIGSSMPFKLEFLEPNLLGIKPEPPDWPERNDIVRVSIERKANSLDIPLSLRLIKRKQKWQGGLVDAGDFTYCSVKKAFSSLVMIISELQSYALHMRESLYSEDLEEIMSRVQREMSASFVWLFQQIFSRTPTLMVYVMILLANFTVNSMADNVVIAATTSPSVSHETITLNTASSTEEKNQETSNLGSISFKELSVNSSSVGNNGGGGGRTVGPVGSGTEGGGRHISRFMPSIQYPNVDPDEILENFSRGNDELVEEEVALWHSVVEEASRMLGESKYKVLDHDIMQQLVSPVAVNLESDDYEDYYRIDLLYQMGVAEDPNNPLLLSNYAQFLYLVAHHHDRAEEGFKRAVEAEPPDAEAFSRYADFLWRVRNDLWGAEERYLEALAAEPNNPFHASKYATFLWSTGGEDTCFPLSGSNKNYYKTL
ncbi:hypothetical protein CFOL_v3_00317 [Cephalotus follicularis]|uniref:Uncharacterized protein n=1 Tax=Cephalotus follicularis TaxID=3775 RepID=A0A1Q3AMC2_CEPFO|nr:hypothetical protein CFOL_v3_00317 [Cephalotus follicularis]